jgi:hypothetical protein
MSSKPVWANIVERTAWTFVQAFLVSLLATSESTLDWSTAQAATAAGVAAIVTLALSAVQGASLPEAVGFYTDLGLRIARSGAAAFLAFLLVEPSAILNGDVWQGALGAAGMAALVTVKGFAAGRVGQDFSPATLPSSLDMTPPPLPDDFYP